MSSPARVIQVGVNGNGRRHLEAVAAAEAAGRVRLVAAVDPTPGDFAAAPVYARLTAWVGIGAGEITRQHAVAGVVVDEFRVWWDPEVLPQVDRAGRDGRIASYQVCDWRTPLEADVLLSRHLPGDGVVDFGVLTRRIEEAGCGHDIEVEVFNAAVWGRDPRRVAEETSIAFGAAVAPHLGRTLGDK